MADANRAGPLVIVESPTKARTIKKFLPADFQVKASVGHVRDLPSSAKDLPAKARKAPWARLGVEIGEDFKAHYVVPKEKQQIVREIKAAVKQASHIYFATDEDREGESISWHLAELLKPKVPHERLVFHEITRDAIGKALDSPRTIDHHLVGAQETRRIVDRLFGFEVSFVLWTKMVQGLSAGRVQSPAVKLLVDRERARIRFKDAAYWGLKAKFLKNGERFEAPLVQLGGKRIVVGKDFDPDTGRLRETPSARGERLLILDQRAAAECQERLRTTLVSVEAVEEKPFSSEPHAPFVTSTLQQQANARLRLRARDTMRLAQQLYENGFITYMRTDSTVLSDEAKSAARDLIVERFGERYLSEKVRYYRNTVKNAQEAHEAIRPAGGKFRAVEEVRRLLGDEHARLYEMIWRRTLASQMRNARGTTSTVTVQAGDMRFQASGRRVEFAGYLMAYRKDLAVEDKEAGGDDRTRLLPGNVRSLPKLQPDDVLVVEDAEASERHTQPPQRYTEGSLIRELEKRGIGRPSTWATVVDLVQSRGYAFRRRGALVPSFTAILVVRLLEDHFQQLVDYQFTAQLEDQLDAIARGEMARQACLKTFYFGSRTNGDPVGGQQGPSGLEGLVKTARENIAPRAVCSMSIEDSDRDRTIQVRIGKFGPFLSDPEDESRTCSVPDDLPPDELTAAKAREMLDDANRAPVLLGESESEGAVYLMHGSFGPYVQFGNDKRKKGTKRAYPADGTAADSIDLAMALKLLSLPRTLGTHPENNADVVVAKGRYGPYVRCGKETRSVPADQSPYDLTMDQALALLRQEKRRGARRSSEPLRVIGSHPETKDEIKVLDGRWGPYVTDGTINASLPRGKDPKAIEMDEAVDLLRARAARIAEGGGRKRRTRRTGRRS